MEPISSGNSSSTSGLKSLTRQTVVKQRRQALPEAASNDPAFDIDSRDDDGGKFAIKSRRSRRFACRNRPAARIIANFHTFDPLLNSSRAQTIIALVVQLKVSAKKL